MAGVPDPRPEGLAVRLAPRPFLRAVYPEATRPSMISVSTTNDTPKPDRAANRGLTPREREVLEMTSHGLTNGQMASRLNLTTHAVKFHLASVYRKLGVANRTEAAVVYLRWQDRPFDDGLGLGD